VGRDAAHDRRCDFDRGEIFLELKDIRRLYPDYDWNSIVSAMSITGRNAMARLVVMYRQPKDVSAFDKYYFEKHLPIAKRIPGLRKYEVSQGPVVTPAGPSGLYLIATLHFDDLAAIQRAFASPEGQAAAADVQLFATVGVDMFLFDSREV
jgi:uncharacterized protein (TIGR02118 family)